MTELCFFIVKISANLFIEEFVNMIDDLITAK